MKGLKKKREKIFGYDFGRGMDRNLKARIEVYARAWSWKNRQPGQHKGPLTRATFEVLSKLLWVFHNSKSGRCFPSHEAIAEKARCSVSTVAKAIASLEAAGILTWANRLVRVTIRGMSKLIRTSNAYAFNLPSGDLLAENLAKPPKSENRSRTQNQNLSSFYKRMESVDKLVFAGAGGDLEALASASTARFHKEWLKKRRG